MDRIENEYLPQVTVDIPGANVTSHSNRNEIHFGRVKFMEPVRKTFTVANTGQVPVRLEFIKKLNDSYACKEWLNITPVRSFIMPGRWCKMHCRQAINFFRLKLSTSLFVSFVTPNLLSCDDFFV